jgi:hypothetical protein
MPRSRVAVALLLLTVALAVGACGDDTGDDTADGIGAGWPRFTASHLGVGFRMPDDPESITQRVQLPDGSPSELVVYRFDAGGWVLIVSTLPLDPASYDLDRAASGAAAGVDGELDSIRSLTVDGRPAREAEIRYESAGEERLLLYRAILLDDGLVQAQTLGAEASRVDLEARHRALVAGLTWD